MLTITLSALLMAPQDPPPTSGILMDIPLAVVGSNTTPPNQLIYSETDVGPVPMPEVDSRFNLAAMVPLPSGSNLVVNSFSHGTGAMFSRMADPNHVHPEVSSGAWSFMLFCVAGTDWEAGSIYETEAATTGGIAGDVFSYVATNSDMFFPEDQVGQVLKAREGTEIGVGTLRGIDSFISGYGATSDYVDAAEEGMGGPRVSFYFTLVSTAGSAAYDNIPAGWGPSGSLSWRQPSTIFVTGWHQSTGWSTPSVFKDAAALGLDAETVIDALSVMDPEFVGDPFGTQGIEVLLSTAEDDLDEQVWVCGTWRLETQTTPVVFRGPLRDITGGLFAESALQLKNGQQGVVASCNDDPGTDGLNPTHHLLRLERTALLTAGGPTGNRDLHFSLHQLRWPKNATFTRYRATLQGFASPLDSYAELYISGSQRPLLSVRRNPAAGLDKQAIELRIPFLGNGAEPVDMTWLVFDRNRQLTGMTDMFQVRAR